MSTIDMGAPLVEFNPEGARVLRRTPRGRRSNLVGRPMVQLLLRENATVTVRQSPTRNLAEVARRADVLIVVLGRQEITGTEHVKEGAVVVDVGIHQRGGGGLVGDGRFEEVEPKASAITPVAGVWVP